MRVALTILLALCGISLSASASEPIDTYYLEPGDSRFVPAPPDNLFQVQYVLFDAQSGQVVGNGANLIVEEVSFQWPVRELLIEMTLHLRGGTIVSEGITRAHIWFAPDGSVAVTDSATFDIAGGTGHFVDACGSILLSGSAVFPNQPPNTTSPVVSLLTAPPDELGEVPLHMTVEVFDCAD